jgi:hypothetical protein
MVLIYTKPSVVTKVKSNSLALEIYHLPSGYGDTEYCPARCPSLPLGSELRTQCFLSPPSALSPRVWRVGYQHVSCYYCCYLPISKQGARSRSVGGGCVC